MSSWVNGNLKAKISIGQGERGASLEYMWRGTELGIRVEGEEEYQFVNLALEGVAGKEIELQVGSGYLQWRYKGEESWNNLIAITELQVQGPQGLPGRDGVNGQDGADGVTPNIQVGTVATLEAGQQATVVNSGTKENPIFDFAIPRGENGADGITPDMTEFKNQINEQYETIEKKVDEHIENCSDGSGGVAESDKVDYIGKQHDTLKEANDSNVEYLLREINTVHYEGSNITATETYQKQVRSAILKGKTGYRDKDTGEILEAFDESKNLELVSVKLPVLITTSDNLCDNSTLRNDAYLDDNGNVSTNYKDIFSEFIPVNSSKSIYVKTWYKIYTPTSFAFYWILQYDERYKFISKTRNYYPNSPFSLNPLTKYIRINLGGNWPSQYTKIEEVQLMVSYDYSNQYRPYKSNILTVDGEYGSVSDVADTVNLITGEVIQRTKLRAYQEGDESNLEVMTDMTNTRYKLAVPLIKTVDLNCQKVYSYDGTTHYNCSAAEGSMIPTLSIDVPTNLSALVSRQRTTIGNQREQIITLEQENETQDELINVSLCATDEMFMLLEPLLSEAVNLNERSVSKMVDLYVAMVMRGLKTIEEVPARYREQVKEILAQLEK